jgi:hypothetical protein
MRSRWRKNKNKNPIKREKTPNKKKRKHLIKKKYISS